MFSFLNDVSRALGGGDYVFGFFLEFSKTFDVFHHALLLQKLERIGLRGKVFEWICTYISGRKQVVEVSGSGSYSGALESTVPISREYCEDWSSFRDQSWALY